MNKKILGLLVVGVLVTSTLTGCQSATKSFGGSMTLNLEPNQKLEEITWKEKSCCRC